VGLLLTLLLAIGFTLGACGRKGGLFLPQETQPEQAVPEKAESEPSTEEVESNKKEKRQSEAP